MNEEKNMEIVPYSFSNLPAAADFNEILSDYAGMEFKLDKIKFPAAGVTVFEVPNSDGELETVKEFSGVILYQHQVNGYYQEAYTGGNNPPDCSSFDGNTGIGTPGGDCKTCPFNQYGSGQNQGKACKNRRWIYILRENEVLPVMLSIPPASLGAFNQYMKRLLCKQLRYSQVVTKLSLSKATNKGGVPYSQLVLKMERLLTNEERAAIAELSGQMQSLIATMLPKTLIQEEFSENGKQIIVNPETGEVISETEN